MSDDTMTADAMAQVAQVAADEAPGRKKVAMVVMSGDMDRLMGAFIIANGAAAMGMDVVMFFTFWGLRAIKRKGVRTGKTLFGRMLGVMYGGDISNASPSKFSFGGIGRWMFKKMMAGNNVQSLPEMRDMAAMLGVRMYPCQMSGDVMEFPVESFIEGAQTPVGVGFFLGEAADANITLFI